MKSKLLGLVATVVLIGFSSAVNAGSVYLQPADQITTLGSSVSVQLWWDFSDDPTFGGGTDIGWDSSILSLTSVEIASNPAFDSAFTRVGTWSAGSINGLATGTFDGLGGPMLIATITFDAIGLGMTVLSVSGNAHPAGPFVSTTSFVAQSVDFSGGSITVNDIPLPAAAWLMISGLGALLGFRRKA